MPLQRFRVKYLLLPKLKGGRHTITKGVKAGLKLQGRTRTIAQGIEQQAYHRPMCKGQVYNCQRCKEAGLPVSQVYGGKHNIA